MKYFIPLLFIPAIIFVLYHVQFHNTVYHFISCRLAPKNVQKLLYNISKKYNGAFAKHDFLLCVVYKGKIYCMKSKHVTVNGLYVVYFVPCILQPYNISGKYYIIYNKSKIITNVRFINRQELIKIFSNPP